MFLTVLLHQWAALSSPDRHLWLWGVAKSLRSEEDSDLFYTFWAAPPSQVKQNLQSLTNGINMASLCPLHVFYDLILQSSQSAAATSRSDLSGAAAPEESASSFRMLSSAGAASSFTMVSSSSVASSSFVASSAGVVFSAPVSSSVAASSCVAPSGGGSTGGAS